MRLLLFLVLLLLPLSAFAQSTPPMPTSDSVTVLHPAPSVSYYFNQSGHSATVIEPAPGLRWYSADNPQGRITAQGFLFDPIPAPKPLTVPPSMRDHPHEPRR